ncbi:major histocompatibility complex class I UBA precursor [Silurus meridionalis]|nr:major histocompatibility complex class I UBA precursor [Silurus meridionalis]
MYAQPIDGNGTTRGYDQYGYDGEDFFSLDLNTGSWTAVIDEVEIFINRWDPIRTEAEYWKNFLETECINWIKKFISHSRETLERKIPPAASVFQKNSSSPEVVCHATGFFPKALIIKWQKDGEDVYEDVELRETLPNEDGSFQKRSILKVSAEELQKHTYTCVIEHSSLEKEMMLKVPKSRGQIGIIMSLVFLVAAVAGIMVWKKKNSGFKPVPPRACK